MIVKLKQGAITCERKGIFTMRLMNKTDIKDQHRRNKFISFHCRRCYEKYLKYLKKYLNQKVL